MTFIRYAGLLALSAFFSLLVCNPALAESRDAQWNEFEQEVKQDCRDFWNAHKDELEMDSWSRFLNEECWVGAQEATYWSDSEGKFKVQDIFCPAYQTKINLDYSLSGRRVQTCITFR
ncbi:MAG: hypothetical protein ACLFSF_07375 [Desulfonatronovibrio sp.]